ncbi:hypothetical protein [Neptuniibacter sp. QD34_54]|uniref:hypothetical protein n=1 Tax=Neptuniibacter sp. QD34_54 TaxID=3398208 RepID=UPI0039F506E2
MTIKVKENVWSSEDEIGFHPFFISHIDVAEDYSIHRPYDLLKGKDEISPQGSLELNRKYGRTIEYNQNRLKVQKRSGNYILDSYIDPTEAVPENTEIYLGPEELRQEAGGDFGVLLVIAVFLTYSFSLLFVGIDISNDRFELEKFINEGLVYFSIFYGVCLIISVLISMKNKKNTSLVKLCRNRMELSIKYEGIDYKIPWEDTVFMVTANRDTFTINNQQYPANIDEFDLVLALPKKYASYQAGTPEHNFVYLMSSGKTHFNCYLYWEYVRRFMQKQPIAECFPFEEADSPVKAAISSENKKITVSGILFLVMLAAFGLLAFPAAIVWWVQGLGKKIPEVPS